MSTNIPEILYHITNSAVLAQILKQQEKILAPKLELINKHIYPFGGSVIPRIINPPVSLIAQCDWSMVNFCVDPNYNPERKLNRNILKKSY